MSTFSSASSVRNKADRTLLESAKLKTGPWNMAPLRGWCPICYWGSPGDTCSTVIPSGHNNTPNIFVQMEKPILSEGCKLPWNTFRPEAHGQEQMGNISKEGTGRKSHGCRDFSLGRDSCSSWFPTTQRAEKTHLCKNKEKPNRVQLPSSQ